MKNLINRQAILLITAILVIAAASLRCNREPSQPDQTSVETQSIPPAETIGGGGGGGGTIQPDASRPFAITKPIENAAVTFSELPEGTTPYQNANHYIIVTPTETETDRWVQDGPVRVNPDGTWRGSAQFGEEDNGIGKGFKIECWATSATLPAGKIEVKDIPPDTKFSPPVIVKRTR